MDYYYTSVLHPIAMRSVDWIASWIVAVHKFYIPLNVKVGMDQQTYLFRKNVMTLSVVKLIQEVFERILFLSVFICSMLDRYCCVAAWFTATWEGRY
jgi:hypothetical protein